MASKIILAFTLLALQAMNREELTKVYNEVYPYPPGEDLSDEGILNDILEVAEPAAEEPLTQDPPSKKKMKEGEFKYGKKVFKAVVPKVFIPGIGERTALEIAADEDAQKYLIKKGCIGSVIVEVV